MMRKVFAALLGLFVTRKPMATPRPAELIVPDPGQMIRLSVGAVAARYRLTDRETAELLAYGRECHDDWGSLGVVRAALRARATELAAHREATAMQAAELRRAGPQHNWTRQKVPHHHRQFASAKVLDIRHYLGRQPRGMG